MIVNLKQLQQQTSVRSISPEFQVGDPRKPIPLSIEQQKKRAKELLRDARNGEARALARLRQAGLKPGEKIGLSDAQSAIAWENGFKKWTDFKSYAEHAMLETMSIASGMPSAPDAAKRTLHIRCGHDIMHKLALAGFVGDYLPFPDPYVMGPTPKTGTLDEFIEARALYLSRWTGSVDSARSRLQSEYAALEQARSYARVMLWFEHDSYDQLTLARLLAFFQIPKNRPLEINYISITGFPGTEIFNGLGQLPPEALRVLWNQFSEVTEKQLRLGGEVWEALTDTNPVALFRLVESATPVLSTMAPAIQRHLRELPSAENGLSLTEHLALKILSDKGSMNAARLFGWYTNHYEPLTFLGDTMFYDVLEGLAATESPAVKIGKLSASPINWHVSLTETGSELLLCKRDWMEINDIDRWVGGVHISRGKPTWRMGSNLEPVLQ
jgi:hypothetical protein